jgi:hypothetical protein
VKNFLGIGLVALLAVASTAGCNPPADYALVGSAYVPAAHGDITIEKIDKQNILVNIVIDHLPPPAQIEADLMHYVVWFTAVGELPARQQALDYDPDLRVGRASIPTSMLDFDVQITAEQIDNPPQPSDLLVASQKVREN